MSPVPDDQIVLGVRAYVHRAWLADEPTTINGAAAALGALVPRQNGRGSMAAPPVLAAFNRLEAQAIAVRDPVLSSRKTRVIAAWNWSGLPLQGQSLATALVGYLAAPLPTEGADIAAPRLVELPDGRTRHLAPVAPETRYVVLSAVRAIVRARFGEAACGTKGDTGYPTLLAACARIPAADLRHLPDEAKRAATAAGAPASAGRYHTAINTLRRYAAEHDLVALHVPPPQHAHPWSGWAARHKVGQPAVLYRLYDAVRATRGAAVPTDPDHVTAADAREALTRIALAKGCGQGKRPAANLESLLVNLGTAGAGPFRDLATRSSLVRVGPRQFGPRWVLATRMNDNRDGASGTSQSWESTVALLEHLGFPAIWSDFYRWYARYSMLPLEVLRDEWGNDFERPGKRHLDASTSRQRHMALRTWLGVAVHELGIRAEACTPAVVFGAQFREVLTALRQAWARRVQEQEALRQLGLPVPGHPVSHDSPTIARHIVNAGLIAEALAVWAEWRVTRGPAVASSEQCAAWRGAYRAANADVEQQATSQDGMRRRGTLRSRRRTQKDIAAIMRDVSSLALVERSNRRVLELIRTAPGAQETAVRVQRALIGAIVAMGAPRIGELGVLEYGLHYKEERGQAAGRTVTRYLAIEADHRKAGGDHQIPLPEAVVPLALWNWHREHGRASLMAPWIAAGHAAHDAVFCSSESGGPFGGLTDYQVADPIAQLEGVARCEANASGALSAQYETWRRSEIAAHGGYELVEGARGHHRAHGGRNQMVRLLVELGLAERLPYLLGHTRESRSEEMYGTSLAETNAETIRLVLAAAPWLRGASKDADAPSSISGWRSRTRAERAQLDRDAALGRAVRDVLARLDGLTPLQALTQLHELREAFGVPVHAAA